MNCVRFVEALGVPQDGADGVFLLLKDTLELLEQSETVQDILPILFRLRLASQQGYAPALTACVSCGKKDFDHAGFLVSEGPSFARIVLPDEEILWKSAAKPLTFCAKYRKYHPCIGIF